jgi:hypothetical protein
MIIFGESAWGVFAILGLIGGVVVWRAVRPPWKSRPIVNDSERGSIL